MSLPATRAVMDRLDPSLLDPGVHAFFFDFDGTLADIALTPDAVTLPPASSSISPGSGWRRAGRSR